MKAYNFSERVKRRSRRIVSESVSRAPSDTKQAHNDAARHIVSFVRSVVRKLPDVVQNALQEAVGGQGDLEHVRKLHREAQMRQVELSEREAMLERSFQDIRVERKSLQELRLNLRGQLKTVQHRSDTLVGTVKRIPIQDVHYQVENAPRAPGELQRLAQNLKRFGQQTPIVAAVSREGFDLITGYRRMEALKLAGIAYVDVRITEPLDLETAAALYIAENCLVRGVSLSEVKRLEEAVSNRQGFAGPISIVLGDDEILEEEMTLEEVTEETRHHLAEAAAWLSALRPYWKDIDPKNRRSLVQLLRYFAQSSKQLS